MIPARVESSPSSALSSPQAISHVCERTDADAHGGAPWWSAKHLQRGRRGRAVAVVVDSAGVEGAREGAPVEACQGEWGGGTGVPREQGFEGARGGEQG